MKKNGFIFSKWSGVMILVFIFALLLPLFSAAKDGNPEKLKSKRLERLETKVRQTSDSQVFTHNRDAPSRTVSALPAIQQEGEKELLEQLDQARRSGHVEIAAVLQAQLDALYGIYPNLSSTGVETTYELLPGPPTQDPKPTWVDGDVLVTNPAYDDVTPSIASAPNGDLYIAAKHLDDNFIRIYKSTDNGESWSWIVGYRTGEDSRNPSITYAQTSTEKWLYLAYESKSGGSDTRYVIVVRVNPDNVSVWDAVTVQSGITMLNAGDYIYPRITSDNLAYPNNPYLYLTYALYGIDYYPVYFTRSIDFGLTWSAPVNVTGGAENSLWPTRPDIAFGSSGLFITFEKLGLSDTTPDTTADTTPTATGDSGTDNSPGTIPAESENSRGQGLFIPVDVSEQLDFNEDPVRVRSRTVQINFGNLGSLQEPAPSIELNLFEDTSFTAQFQRTESNVLGSYAWVGRLKGVPLGQAVLVMTNGILAGSVSMPGAIYQIRLMGDNVYVIEEIDQSAFPSELPPIPAPPDYSPAPEGLVPDTCTEIKVLVAYSPEARAADGGTSAILSRIALAVTETNQSYVNSSMTQRIELVGTIETSAGDAANAFYTDLPALANLSDGIFDNVDAQRDALYADMVSLIIEDASACGLAYLNSTAASAFSTVHRTCATGYYSFGHELGHNMSARHDWYMDDTLNNPYSYSKGYVNVPDRWRTVMSYNNLCSDSPPGTSCTRLQYWSNPGVTYGGDAMGVIYTGPVNCISGSTTPHPSTCAADNHLALNNTCSTVANFRQDPVSWDKQIFVTESNNFGAIWSTPAQVTDSTDEQYHPRVAASLGDSTILVALTRDYGDTGDLDVTYVYSEDGGSTWLGDYWLPWTYDDEESVDLAVSNNQGNFHAAYWHGYDIWYTTAPVADPSNWSSAAIVNEMNWASHNYVRPTVTVNPNLPLDAEAAIAWTDYRGYYYDVYFDSPGLGLGAFGDELAGDFGASGLWHYDGATWSKKTSWNADDDLAGWAGGLAADFGGNGLWNYDGMAWTKKTSWNAGSGGMAGWSEGLAADFDGNGLWNYDGSNWTKKTSWNADNDLAGWYGGLAVDFGANGLWNYDGAWSKTTGWNPGSGGMAGWNGGLAADFDGNGLWNYDGTWSKKTSWDPGSGGMAGWAGGLAVDFDSNGLWNYDGGTWSKKTSWNPEGISALGDGFAADFGASGFWYYDGATWSKKTSWDAENLTDVDLY